MRVVIKDVPKFEIPANKPLVMFGLLKYENKMSVMNLVLKRVNQSAYDLPIKSKERLIFHVGARRFACGPIFSQHTTGDKQKVNKFPFNLNCNFAKQKAIRNIINLSSKDSCQRAVPLLQQ